MLRNLPRLCEEIAKELDLCGGPPAKHPAQVPGPDPALPSAEELFRIAADGGRDALGRRLDLPAETLVAIVAALGVDPARRVRRWKDASRIREFLLDEIMVRAERNRSFLTDDENSVREIGRAHV